MDGGGCLDLPGAAAAELGLEEDSLTGTWDFAHNLQIIWKNSLGQHPAVEELIDFMFNVMDDYRTGQAGALFRTRAAEFGHLVLTNKKRQTTRFVRSLQRALQAYLRNLPTLVYIMSKRYEEASREGRNKEAREVLAKLSKLRDPRQLLLTVGLAQTLELYTTASLQSQHYKRFPTQAWAVVMKMREEVRALGQNWVWEEKDLKYAGIEAPSKVKERLVTEGRYRPKVSEAQARGSRVRRDTNLLDEGQKVADLFDEDGESVVPLAGEVCMEVPLIWRLRRGVHDPEDQDDGRGGGTRHLTVEDVTGVEHELEELAKEVDKTWSERQEQTSMEKASYGAFGEKFDWGEDQGKVEQEGVAAVVGVQNTMKMRALLENLVASLPEMQGEKFEGVDTILEGYSSYLKYLTKKKAEMEVGDHTVYESWFKVKHLGISKF